jgi:hypothetical protein
VNYLEINVYNCGWNNISCCCFNVMLDYYYKIPFRTRKYIRFEFTILLTSFLIYLINQFYFKEMNVGISWFINYYLNDCLAPILLFSYSNILILALKHRKITNFLILFCFISVVGLFWEYGSPIFIQTTSDLFDLVSYYIGFLLYWIIEYLLNLTYLNR